jgi:hypothetical protein
MLLLIFMLISLALGILAAHLAMFRPLPFAAII